MSAMNFREPNQARWLGVRPAHNGEQLVAYNITTNDDRSIYQVPSGKTAYITSMIITATSGSVGGNVQVNYTDSANNLIKRLVNHFFRVTGNIAFSVSFNPPLELINQQRIRAYSNANDATITVFLHGWEE